MGNWSFSEFVLIAIDVFPSSKKGGQIVTDPMFFFDPIRTSEELPANISCPICWCLTIFVAQKNRPFRDFLVYVGNMLLSSWHDAPPFLMSHIFSREVLPCHRQGRCPKWMACGFPRAARSTVKTCGRRSWQGWVSISSIGTYLNNVGYELWCY